jgi:exopolysaccharide production protein ExoZ
MKEATDRSVSPRPRVGGAVLSIQYLRALAALGVVLSHASISLLPNERFVIPLKSGTAGVDMFFVISGFIMYYTTADRDVSPGQFLLRRVVRVAPLYFLFTTLGWLIARHAGISVHTFSPYLVDYIRSILFVPYYNVRTGIPPFQIRPVVGQGWTLNYEMFFYAMFGVCLMFRATGRVYTLVGISVILSLIGVYVHPYGAVLRTYTDSLLLEFSFGLLLGYLFIQNINGHNTSPRKRSLQLAVGLALTTTAVIILIAEDVLKFGVPRVLAFGLPAAGLVGGLLLLELAGRVRRWPLLLLLGDASYSLYLLHTFVLAVLHRAWEHAFGTSRVTSHVGFLITGGLLCEALGIIVFIYVERPTTQHISSFLHRHRVLRSERRLRILQVAGKKQQILRARI